MPMSGLAQEIHGAMALLAVSAARMGARQSALKLRVPSLRAGLGVMIRALGVSPNGLDSLVVHIRYTRKFRHRNTLLLCNFSYSQSEHGTIPLYVMGRV